MHRSHSLMKTIPSTMNYILIQDDQRAWHCVFNLDQSITLITYNLIRHGLLQNRHRSYHSETHLLLKICEILYVHNFYICSAVENCSCVPVVSCWEVVSHNYSRFDAARWSGDAMDQAFIPLFWWLSVYTNNTAPDLFAVQWIRRLISGRSAQKLLFTNAWTCSFSINEWIVPFKTMACTTAIICVCISNLHNYIIMLNWYKIL